MVNILKTSKRISEKKQKCGWKRYIRLWSPKKKCTSVVNVHTQASLNQPWLDIWKRYTTTSQPSTHVTSVKEDLPEMNISKVTRSTSIPKLPEQTLTFLTNDLAIIILFTYFDIPIVVSDNLLINQFQIRIYKDECN